jgi:hypothetical protein
MTRPPLRVLLAVAAVAAVALAAFLAAWRWDSAAMTPVRWVVAAELVIAVTAARLVPVPLTRRILHTVNTTAYLLAAVLLPLPVVMVGVAAVCVSTDVARRLSGADQGRMPWYGTTFNAGQHVLRVAAGGAVFSAVSGAQLLSGRISDRALFGVVLAGLAVYAVNIVLLHAIVCVQEARWQLGALRRLVRVNLPQEGSLLLLGILGAIIAGPAPLLVALPLLATIIIYRELALQRPDAPIELIRDEEPAVRAAASAPASMPAFWSGAY